MKPSLLALDYLAGIKMDNINYHYLDSEEIKKADLPLLLNEDYKDLYVRPECVIKSSVGEFYDKTMKFFFDTIKELYAPIKDRCDRPNLVLFTLFPLGYASPEKLYCNIPITRWQFSLAALQTNYTLEGICHVLSEIRDLIKDVRSPNLDKHKDRYANKMKDVEKIANSICVGYAPQLCVPQVTCLKNDSGYISEYILSSILYPWVMQPLSQLRMLTPSLPENIREGIMDSVIDKESGMHIGSGFDTGYPFIFDILGDFKTYMDFRNVSSPYGFSLQRQFWTPFLKFDEHSVIKDIKNKKIRNLIDECVKRSYKLYLEMLKTGLRYESQYAVLVGHRGRFCLSATLASAISFINKLSDIDVRYYMTDAIVEQIKKEIRSAVPFIKDNKLFRKDSET